MRFALTFGCVLLMSAAVFAQAPTHLAFDVASIRPVQSEEARVTAAARVDGAQVHYANFNVKDFIRFAYTVKNYQITGPDGFDSQRYNIDATLPAGATQSQVPEMLQTLLADRFGLKFHRDTKTFDVYALIAPKGDAKITPSAPNPTLDAAASDPSKTPTSVTGSGSAQGVTVDLGGGASYSFTPEDGFQAKRLTMVRLADVLSRFEDRPVVDMTGLKGLYDVKIPVTPEGYQVMLIRSAIAAGVNLPPQAMQYLTVAGNDTSLESGLEAFGLKLDARKAPLEVLVVDHVNPTPAGN